jgi:phospholipase/carboxylesterase
MDPIAPPASAQGLADALRQAGAAVRHETVPASHGLVQRDLALAQEALGG